MRRSAMITATAGLALVCLTPNAAAASPWHPVTEPGLTLPAGRYCDFQVTASGDFQKVRERVTETWPDGSPRIVDYRGPLRSTFTNDVTGASVTLNLSGSATAWLRHDGSMERYETRGPVGFGFRAGDDMARGYYRLVGHHVVTFDADGTRHLDLAHGQQQDVCAMLS